MIKGSLRLILPLLAVLGAACGSERGFGPERQPIGPGRQPTLNPEIDGVYDLTALITRFDPAWGDLTGYRYTAVLTLRQDNRDTFEGTYADLQLVGPDGESSDWEYTGFVRGSLGLDGRVVVELVGGNHTWTTWWGQGKLVSGVIDGAWGCCGHIGGTFTATRRP